MRAMTATRQIEERALAVPQGGAFGIGCGNGGGAKAVLPTGRRGTVAGLQSLPRLAPRPI